MLRNYLSKQEAEKKSISFSTWADTWYADYRTEVEASTYWSYSFTLKTLKDYFGHRPIQDIKQMDINHFIDHLDERGLSKSTIGKCKSMLVQVFSSAEDNDLITKNPAVRSKSVKAKKHVYKKAAYTPKDIRAMRAFLPDNLLGNSILTLIGTGLRVQELLALTKNDIAPDGSYVIVNKAVKMANREPSLGTTKSECGIRTIPVSEEYRHNVRYLRDHGGNPYIWTSNRDNSLYSVEEFRNRYKTVMSKVPGITVYPPHCCRHTYITNLQAGHVPMDIIRILAGHQETSTTQDYAHPSFETLKQVIDALDKEA